MLNKLAALREKNEDGFTLIELLIVVVIIGILAAIAIPIFLNQQKAAIAASVKSDVRNNVTLAATWLTTNPQETNMRSAIPEPRRVKSSTDTSLTFATNYDQSTGNYSGYGSWDKYIVIAWNSNLGSTLGATSTAAYWFDSTTGKYQGRGELS